MKRLLLKLNIIAEPQTAIQNTPKEITIPKTRSTVFPQNMTEQQWQQQQSQFNNWVRDLYRETYSTAR